MDRVSRYTPPLEDLSFILDRVIGVSALYSHEPFRHVDDDTARAVLIEAGRFASEILAPINAVGDIQGSQLINGRVKTPDGFPEAYRALIEGGWIGLDMPVEYGGQDLPLSLQTAYAEMVNGACVAFGMLPLMQRAAASLLITHADKSLVDMLAPALVAGDCGATICISEPQAGSDAGRISTMAQQDADGIWRVTGSKIFITYGDQDFTSQIMHILLARTPNAPPGTRGLSLFAVPARLIGDNGEPGERNGVTVTRVEHKMGLKASPTCVMDFENAVSYPVGTVGAGMRGMFSMMNAMRLEVSVQGVAIAGAATARAMEYASERLQGGAATQPPVLLNRHADIRRMLFEMRALSEGYRALTLQTAHLLDLAKAAKSGDERSSALGLAEWLLPVCKAGGSEAGFQVANLAVQIFGGHGYVCDSGIEQYVRDSRIMSIYEGTNGIQALDLTVRKLGMESAFRQRLFVDAVRNDIARLSSVCPELVELLVSAVNDLESASDWILIRIGKSDRDIEAAATPYLQLTALTALGWMWLRMAAAAAETSLANAKQATANFFFSQLLPGTRLHLCRIRAGAKVLDSISADELCRYPN